MAVQPGLCRTWSETPKTGVLMTRLISITDIPQCANRNCDVNNNGYCVEDFGGLPGYHCGCYQGYILFTENGPNHGYSVAAGETGFRYGDKYYYDHTCISKSFNYVVSSFLVRSFLQLQTTRTGIARSDH